MKKVLLLENIHPIARDLFVKEGFQVDTMKGAFTEAELIQKVPGYDILGIRSKTFLTPKFFEAAESVGTVGCFCVGTNQVDLNAARSHGTVVFNAPFSNTRSVAEMVIAEIVMLSRKLGTRNTEMHQGVWNKGSVQCFEVRGKTLGIVGYGNIGVQVSYLAEAMGMRVVFYDVISKLPIGNAKPMSTLEECLAESDFVTLHVPATDGTYRMIGTNEIKQMKPGSYLINNARGDVVDIPALEAAITSKHLAGCALDVYPEEPENNTNSYSSPMKGVENVILTPHIGGATEEAQVNIGREVASTLIRFAQTGSTFRSVNFPQTDIPLDRQFTRLTNVHQNVKGVLKDINEILSSAGANIQAQSLHTDKDIGYLITDLNQPITDDLIKTIQNLKTSIRTRRVL
ncbi:MAG: phosphoglycerate dehydrogenase [Bdellovibrionales bacterium]|nr:phosphoglycerate dehydrogenase [Bdellovibrionales bacterium]